jgi:SOS-response transcriptional repressor LexA
MLLHASEFWQEVAMMMVRKSKGITDKHIKVLEFVNDYQTRYGRPPSIREIGEKVKISSTSVVNYYLLQLEKMGYLERDNRVSRGMRLTDKVNQIVQAGNTLHIPILGPIAAGIPLPELQPGAQKVRRMPWILHAASSHPRKRVMAFMRFKSRETP